MLILGVESSCDETAAAVLEDGRLLRSNIINSQIAVHAEYGGVVPELASRHHLLNIYPVVQEALCQAEVTIDDIDALAVTQGPGLIGSLLVGLSFVKALALVRGLPFTGVDHLSGHISAVFLGERRPDYPFVALVASGGHSSIFQVSGPLDYRLLGCSRDDAAGEAFDKVAKLLGLSYPGGPVVAERALEGDGRAIKFPRAWLKADSLDFSFSGLKTSVVNYVNQCRMKKKPIPIADICASFQEAVVEVLVEKTIMAARQRGIKHLTAAGGVASNQRLREELSRRCREEGMELFLTPAEFCTDNAAMIALAGWYRLQNGETSDNDLDVYSRSSLWT